jgi:hypothetical protein
MTKTVRATTLVLFVLACTTAQAASLADRVFEHANGSPALLQALTPADRQTIVALLPVTLTPDGKIIDNADYCHQEAKPEVSVVDLRHDGQPAVFAISGNLCTSGSTGASLYLVAKVDGQWKRYFDVPAIEYRVMPAQVNGWPEVGLLGRYACMGVWQFDGKAYRHARNVDERGSMCKQ